MSTASTSASDEALLESQAVYGCELIQTMGILLKLPQVAVSTAQVSFHRFYAKRSMRKFDVRVRASSQLFFFSFISAPGARHPTRASTPSHARSISPWAPCSCRPRWRSAHERCVTCLPSSCTSSRSARG